MQNSDYDVGGRTAFEASNMIRALTFYGLPTSFMSVSALTHTNNFVDSVLADATRYGGDFKCSRFIELIKPLETRTGLLTRTIVCGRDSPRFRELHQSLLAVVGELSVSNNAPPASLKILHDACECKLHSLRYLATFILVFSVHSLGTMSSPILDSLFAILSIRTQDTCPKIRQLASIGGFLEPYLLHRGSVCVSRDTFVETIRNLLRDPSYLVRISVLKYLQDTVAKNREYLEIIRPMSREIGEEAFARCFDSASSTVSILAIRLLSDPMLGEVLLGGDEDKYQRLSLLVWQLSSSERNVSLIAKEALGFINNHILANPGILSDKVTGSQKLLMMAEFIEQYSDGLVYPLTGRFILAYSAHVSRGAKNCLLREETFAPVIEELVDAIRDSIVRRGTLSRIFEGLSSNENAQSDITLKLRLNTVLEILYNASVIFATTDMMTTRILQSISKLFDCWDEAEDPCGFHECQLSDSQADIRAEALKRGIRPRRFLFEIVQALLKARFPEQALTYLESNILDNDNSRALTFSLVRDAIERVLIHMS